MGLGLPHLVVLVIIIVIYIILGTFMEVLAMLAVTLPIFFPMIAALGIDGIWFGVIVVAVTEIATLTPPVGLISYAVKAAVGEEIELGQVFKGIIPFFLAYLVAVALIVVFPPIALWLPNMMR